MDPLQLIPGTFAVYFTVDMFMAVCERFGYVPTVAVIFAALWIASRLVNCRN